MESCECERRRCKYGEGNYDTDKNRKKLIKYPTFDID